MTELQKRTFIGEILKWALKYAPQYGINYVSPIIAQACLESRYGESGLSAKYHNYFGMKCGSSWKGASVNMKTSEEYTPGVHTTIKDNFRVYANMEQGVIGYFEFIQAKRYSNLRNAVSADDYCEKIKADGWATSSTYVENLKRIMDQYGLREYDKLVGTIANGGEIVLSAELLKSSTHINNESTTKTYKPVTDDVVNAVIRGNYGNGATRKSRLEKAGYNYEAVRAAVNKKLKG